MEPSPTNESNLVYWIIGVFASFIFAAGVITGIFLIRKKRRTINLAFIDNNEPSSSNEIRNSDFFDDNSAPSRNEINNLENNGGQGHEHGFLTRVQIYFAQIRRRRELRRNAEAVGLNCFSVGENSDHQDDERILQKEEEGTI